MLVQSNYVRKEEVKFCLKEDTVEKALERFKEYGYRCLPVIDKKGKYEGMIYKVHLYEFQLDNGDIKNQTIEPLLKEKETFIEEETSFYKALFTIKRLPFLALIDKRKKFLGILTHTKVMEVLEDSIGVKTGGYTFTIAAHEYQGAISKISKVISKFTNIEGILSLDDGSTFLRRIVITVPKIKEEDLQELKRAIEKNGFRVVFVDKIEK